MKTVILCGGLGTRLSEETQLKPKPMIEIGDRPILWHIMKHYETNGFKDFILALGYKGEIIKDYFLNYHPRTSNITVELKNGQAIYENHADENWVVNLVDTGQQSLTGGRLHRLEKWLASEKTFMLTYGDGVSDVDINALVKFHKQHGKLATMTAVRPPARFGTMIFNEDQVVDFHEKPQIGEGWINGGFFVFERKIFDYLHGDSTILEKAPLETLACDGQLMAYKHHGFWHCMDTLRDKNYLHDIWNNAQAPWKTWSNG